MFRSGHTLIFHTKKTITLLLMKLRVVDGISHTIAVIFEKNNLLDMWLQFYWEIIRIHRKCLSTSTLVTRNDCYNSSIVHRYADMMKDVDDLSHNIKPLIHQYLVTNSIMYSDDHKLHSFVYNYDAFHSCFNPRHTKSSKST